MRNTLRHVLMGTLAAVTGFIVTTSNGCGTPPPVTPDVAGPKCLDQPIGCCSRPADCGVNRFDYVCSEPEGRKICRKLCSSNSNCTAPETCEDGICRPPACGNDSECGNGDQCSGGTCVPRYAATQVASCQVLPAKAILHQGATKNFTVVAKDSAGKAIGYKGDITWGASSANATVAAGVATGGSATGDVNITATVGSTTCTPAAAKNFATNSSGVRVIVADLLSSEPLAGVTVEINGTDARNDTDANGVVSFDFNPEGAFTVSAYGDAQHAYVTYVGVTSRDLVVYLKPAAIAGTFTGSMPSAKFDGLSDEQGNVRLALFGGSIPGNLIDLQLANLIGEIDSDNPTKIEFGSTAVEVPLPGGILIGLGDNMFKSDYSVPATPGVRAIWGLGGNARIEAITQALQPVISGSGSTEDLDVGPILAGILPLLSRLQSGVTAGVNVVSGASTPLEIALTTLLRIRLEAKLPDLPPYSIDGVEQRVDGAIVLGGSLYSPQGLIPLGLTAGLDLKGGPKDENGKDTPDGKVDAEANGTAGTVSLRVAPLHGGLENSKYVVLALGASFSALAGGLGGGDPAPGEPAPVEPPLVLMGLVSFPESVGFNNGTPSEVTFRSGGFLGVPSTPRVVNRTFNSGAAVEGATFHRLDIGDVENGEWFVYFAPGADKEFAIPNPPEGKTDRFFMSGDVALESQPGIILQSVSVKGGKTFQELATFNGLNFDDLTLDVDAFTTRGLPRSPAEM